MIAVLDVGGSSVKAGRVGDDGRTIGDVTVTVLDHDASADELIDRLATAARTVDAGEAIALAIPEPFDYDAGVSLMTHKFASLHGIDVVARLTAKLGGERDVRCCNDAAAAVMGEAVAGAGAEHRRVLGITLGTGLGAAFVVDGRPVRSIDGLVIGDLYAQTLDDGRLADDALSARGYQERRSAGEVDIDATFGRELGAFLRPVVATIHADIVVVGGGGTASFDRFAEAARGELPVPFRCAALDAWAPLIGAARLCFAPNVG